MLAQPASGQADEKKPQYKDPAEYELYDSILKDANPKTKLEKLQQWQSKYPSTEFSKDRRQLFFTTYIALNQAKETVDVAKQILADDPKNFSAQYYIMYYTQGLYTANQTPDVLNQGEKAA